MADVSLDNTACPRCGGGFRCGVNDGHCACFGLRLSEELKAQLTAQYPGQCLCLPCLATLAAMETALPALPEVVDGGSSPRRT